MNAPFRIPAPEPPIYFASEPIIIGAHAWRVVVTDSAFGGRRFAYQFHAMEDLPIWQEQTRWPAFDFHLASMGLPRELARLYEANLPEIKKALRDWRADPEIVHYAQFL